MKKLLYLIIILFIAFSTANFGKDFNSLEEKVTFYKNLYGVNCANEKITDNFGNGFDDLYGTRNMKTILYGIAYRGGANNFYHKTDKRNNHNPLPDDGLTNLCLNGFSNAIYLYATNYATAPKTTIKNDDTLQYLNNSGNERANMKKILLLVKDIIDNPNKGPVYIHCWNGWHQSGYVSSAILMQFCGISNDEAYTYWLNNTDGMKKGFENVKKQIKEFTPFNDITIPKEVSSLICPCLNK